MADKKAAEEEDPGEADDPRRSRPAAWLGASNLAPRYGQSFNLSWRASEPVKLWQEGPDRVFHWQVSPRGSKAGPNPLAAGKFTFSVRNEAGDVPRLSGADRKDVEDPVGTPSTPPPVGLRGDRPPQVDPVCGCGVPA